MSSPSPLSPRVRVAWNDRTESWVVRHNGMPVTERRTKREALADGRELAREVNGVLEAQSKRTLTWRTVVTWG